ncbi:dolichyl-phosphate beta-D-mannosyltransferase [candidate division TA06 bacterium SM1_40]|uniref:Dolichyl-phosphate beta-D-mannosyltransferase n=2 Tax=Bacteria division TA06 TaxID=1156500 RepID=A0A0S8JHY9_UNCT6|nr:MAG: dolichyl-phosphate beta-D-mannosyltransferase [candidate division TA06 bacterium SM23_40]KPL09401.1 MAG: dolichyl-phosphate beta-D-mannosyltransferase [candidate division TA06 bacterium SM1_40]
MRTLVVVPTYNEKENIERIIEEVLATNPEVEILVVDDNSPDGTGEIIDRRSEQEPRVHVLHREGKLGLGSAYVAGFKYAIREGYDAVFEMDADFSHDPKVIPEFLKKLVDYDLVLGSRYLDGVSVINWPMSRLLLSYFANIYARVVTGAPIRDLTGGYKCFRREVLEAIDLDKIHSDGYAFQIEMDVKTWRKGFRVLEIPIIFVERGVGTSKMSRRIIWEALWLVWRLRFASLLGRLK